MTTTRTLALLASASAIVLGYTLCASAALDDPIPYPANYREWAHVKSAVIGPTHKFFETEGGIHHIYANAQAREGYRSGSFPDGAVIVYELLETHESAGVVSEGQRRRVDVMIKDQTRYASTGGWGFERFRADSHTDRIADAQLKTQCFTCHQTQQQHGHVFSTFRP